MEYVAPIMSIFGAITGFAGERRRSSALEDTAESQRAASEQAVRISEQNAAAQEAETAEQVRRETLASEEAQSLRKARAAASGGTLTGSTGAYLEEQAEREADFISWLERSGASRAEIERERGKLAGMEGRATARATEGQVEEAKWSSIGKLTGVGTGLYDIYNL